MNEKFKNAFQKFSGYAAIAAVSLIYIATSFLQLDKSGKTVAEIIVDGTLVFLLGFFINRLFDLQGIMDGERDDKFRGSMDYHAETVDSISPYIDKLDGWCDEKNKENYRTQRTRILAYEGMKYSDYFDEEGTAKEFIPDERKLNNKYLRRIELKRIKCFYKALHVKLTPLSACELTSEGANMDDPYFFGRSKREYEKQSSTSDVISKIAVALIFGYYGVTLIQDFSFAQLIWNTLQVGIFILMGITKMYNSYIFITGEFRGRMVKKATVLKMFLNVVRPKAPKAPVPLITTEEKEKEETEDGKNFGRNAQ